MKLLSLLVIGLLAVSLLLGCSKEEKETSQLEREQFVQDSIRMADSLALLKVIEDSLAASKAAESTKTTPSMPAHQVMGYTVQTAACESLDYAQFLVDRYTQRGYEPYITDVTVGDQKYYRVRIGDFQTRQEAKTLKDELLDKYSVQAWIDKP
jgi:septal ring-binding cell division protein DamX